MIGQYVRMEEWRTKALIKLVLDPAAPEHERVDAAADLCENDDPHVRAALVRICCDQTLGEPLIADCAGESLGEIAARTAPLTAEELAPFDRQALREYRASYEHFISVDNGAVMS
ncbi:hypothetical protein ACIRYZ_46530 [Kitasatospora sp. NPDC101155]|uniref:hypothetical protein n=1 Tax=Kitasatospora sp. NPDC101155 TaxID=3364097 RepID=UPI003817BD87